MPIVAADLQFFASERMTDNTSTSLTEGGGGDMGAAVIPAGVANNVFPDVMPGDRTAGATHMRKLYAAVLSLDRDALASAQVRMLERPSDPLVEVCVHGSESSLGVDQNWVRSQALPRLSARQDSPSIYGLSAGTLGDNTVTFTVVDPSTVFAVGDKVTVAKLPSGFGEAVYAGWRNVTAVTSTTLTFDGAGVTSGWSSDVFAVRYMARATSGYPVAGLSLTTGSTTAGATAVTLDRLDVRTMQAADAAAVLAAGTVFDPTYPKTNSTLLSGGRAPLLFPGDIALLQHPTVAATREYATVSRVNWTTGVVTFTGALVNAYPINTRVTRPITLRTLQANVPATPFRQQAWTRVWSDTAIGSSISANYTGAIDLVNEGAVNDRWAVVFTSATQFDLLSERLGTVGSGNIASNFSPLNPTTNEPYLTLYAAGWGTGWITGNVLRFNTRAAAAPFWVARVVAPGAATSGTQQATLGIAGDIDA